MYQDIMLNEKNQYNYTLKEWVRQANAFPNIHEAYDHCLILLNFLNQKIQDSKILLTLEHKREECNVSE